MFPPLRSVTDDKAEDKLEGANRRGACALTTPSSSMNIDGTNRPAPLWRDVPKSPQFATTEFPRWIDYWYCSSPAGESRFNGVHNQESLFLKASQLIHRLRDELDELFIEDFLIPEKPLS